MIENALQFWSHNIILVNIVHASGGFGLALLLQRYIKGKAFLPSWVGWLLLTFAIGAHIVAFITPVSANGGDQRVVDGKYLINLSRAPFTPYPGDKVAFLASFVDIEKNKLISEDLTVTVRIAKLGGSGTEKRTFLFEKEKIPVKGGILELPFIFTESGLHEIFFDFVFDSNPQKIYEAPDFLIDIQRSLTGYSKNQVLMAVLSSLVVGLIAGWFVKRIVSSRVG